MARAIRVLIADDHRMFREALRRMIHDEGRIEVVGEATNGHEVVNLVGKVPADVLLLDLAMPGASGLDALKQLADKGAPIRTIVVTGSDDRREVALAVRLGARGVVVKDASVEMLVKSIEHVAAGHYWIGHERLADLLETVAKPAPPRPVDTLTRRELQIIAAVMQGATNREIGAQLSLSEQTVKNHLASVFDKLGVSNRLELALYAHNHQLVSDGGEA